MHFNKFSRAYFDLIWHQSSHYNLTGVSLLQRPAHDNILMCIYHAVCQSNYTSIHRPQRLSAIATKQKMLPPAERPNLPLLHFGLHLLLLLAKQANSSLEEGSGWMQWRAQPHPQNKAQNNHRSMPLHFPNVSCSQTCLPTWYQVRFLSILEGNGAVPGTVLRTSWEALRNKNLMIQCLRGWYQVRFFGLVFGHSWGIGEGPGWHLVRYLCETREALHERHVWKTLKVHIPFSFSVCVPGRTAGFCADPLG